MTFEPIVRAMPLPSPRGPVSAELVRTLTGGCDTLDADGPAGGPAPHLIGAWTAGGTSLRAPLAEPSLTLDRTA